MCSGIWCPAIDLLLCMSWLDHPVPLLYKGHRRIEISFAWKQMPINITGEGQKWNKKHLIGVVDAGRMLEMVPVFPKAFCFSVSQAASSLKFSSVCAGKNMVERAELSSHGSQVYWSLWQGCSSLKREKCLAPTRQWNDKCESSTSDLFPVPVTKSCCWFCLFPDGVFTYSCPHSSCHCSL